MGSKMWCFSQYCSALQETKRIMEVELKRVQGQGNQDSHNWCSNANE